VVKLLGQERERRAARGERLGLPREALRMVPVVVVPLRDERPARQRDGAVAKLAERLARRDTLDLRGQRRAQREELDGRVERRVGVVHDDELALAMRLAREIADRVREARQGAVARDRQRADQHAGSKMRAMRTSAIVTYRGADGSERRANLDAVLSWLAATPDVEAIVVEQDVFPRLEAPLPHPAARVVFAYNAGPFNKAWGLNVGARHASGGVLLLGDGDVIVPGGLAQAAAICASSMQMVKPYRTLVDLTQEESARVRAGRPGERLDLDLGRAATATRSASASCCAAAGSRCAATRSRRSAASTSASSAGAARTTR
jgi:hypothetical protein